MCSILPPTVWFVCSPVCFLTLSSTVLCQPTFATELCGSTPASSTSVLLRLPCERQWTLVRVNYVHSNHQNKAVLIKVLSCFLRQQMWIPYFTQNACFIPFMTWSSCRLVVRDHVTSSCTFPCGVPITIVCGTRSTTPAAQRAWSQWTCTRVSAGKSTSIYEAQRALNLECSKRVSLEI